MSSEPRLLPDVHPTGAGLVVLIIAVVLWLIILVILFAYRPAVYYRPNRSMLDRLYDVFVVPATFALLLIPLLCIPILTTFGPAQS